MSKKSWILRDLGVRLGVGCFPNRVLLAHGERRKTLRGGVGSSAREGEGPSCRPEKGGRGGSARAPRPRKKLGRAGVAGWASAEGSPGKPSPLFLFFFLFFLFQNNFPGRILCANKF